MPFTHDIIVVGASAGGLPALKELVAAFPADLPASVFVVSHLSPHSPSLLPEILARQGPLPASVPDDHEPIAHRRIYVAPSDCHLLVERNQVRVVRGPKENRHRPAVDPLFRSAAWAYGPRVVGVVLSGNLDDGTAGLWAIKTCGGTTVVQAPTDALYPDMPRSAVLENEVDHILPVREIGPLLVDLAGQVVDGAPELNPPERIKTEIEFAKMNRDVSDMNTLGALSPFTCPACRGALWELHDGDHLRYRCHVGHAYSRDTLLSEQTTAIEDALFQALRAVEEKATALRRLSERHAGRSAPLMTEFSERADSLEGTAEVLKELLNGRGDS
jgi:two-component system, chemotaxis family, protein-glutamate methylesterase/glutaminase